MQGVAGAAPLLSCTSTSLPGLAAALIRGRVDSRHCLRTHAPHGGGRREPPAVGRRPPPAAVGQEGGGAAALAAASSPGLRQAAATTSHGRCREWSKSVHATEGRYNICTVCTYEGGGEWGPGGGAGGRRGKPREEPLPTPTWWP